MRVNIEFNQLGYIQTLRSDIDGEFEIDENTFNFDYVDCYHLVDNILVFDETKKQLDIENENKVNEIYYLKNMLTQTDYITAKCFEEIMALDNKLTFIVDFIAIVVKYSKQYKEVIAERKAWRERIEELEND